MDGGRYGDGRLGGDKYGDGRPGGGKYGDGGSGGGIVQYTPLGSEFGAIKLIGEMKFVAVGIAVTAKIVKRATRNHGYSAELAERATRNGKQPCHLRCASCVKLSHDCRGVGSIWFDR